MQSYQSDDDIEEFNRKLYSEKPVESQMAESNLRAAKQYTPEDYAEATAIGEKNGIDPTLVIRKLPEWRAKQQGNRTVDAEKNPKTATYLSNPDNAAISQDDLEFLKAIEDRLGSSDKEINSAHLMNLVSDRAKSLYLHGVAGTGMLLDAYGKAGDKLLQMVGADPDDEEYSEAGRKLIPMLLEIYGKDIEKHEETREQPYANPETIKHKYRTGDAGDVISETGRYVLEASAGSVPDLAMLASNVTIPAYLVARSDEMGRNNAANSGEEYSIKHFNRALPFAMASAALDKWALVKMLGAGKADKEAIKKLLTEGGKIAALKYGAVETLKATGYESGTEFLQESLVEPMGEIAWTPVEYDLWKNMERGAWAALAAGPMAASISAPASAINIAAIRSKARQEEELDLILRSENDQQIISDVISLAQETKTGKLAPGKLGEFTGLMNDREVTIHGEAIADIQARGIAIPHGLLDSYAQESNGGDITISVADLVGASVSNPDFVNAARPHMKLRGDGYTLAQIESGENLAYLRDLVRNAERRIADDKELSDLQKRLTQELIDTRRVPRNMAPVQARLLTAYIATKADALKRSGVETSISQEADRMRLSIVGPRQEVGQSYKAAKARYEFGEDPDVVEADTGWRKDGKNYVYDTSRITDTGAERVSGKRVKDFVNDPAFEKSFPALANKVVNFVEKPSEKAQIGVLEIPIDSDVSTYVRDAIERDAIPAARVEQDAELQANFLAKINGDRIIRLFNMSNASSFAHESAHLMLDMEREYAMEFGVTEAQTKLLAWLGAASFDEITVAHHEKFARSFEAYLMEGKAPSLELRDTFSAFKRWLVRIYETVRGIPGQAIDPEIRYLFDRLLATEEEISSALDTTPYDQIFSSADDAGMTQAEWADYSKTEGKRKEASMQELEKKIYDQLKKRREDEYKQERGEVKEKMQSEVADQRVYRLRNFLKTEKLSGAQVREIMHLPTPDQLKAERLNDKYMASINDTLINRIGKRLGGIDADWLITKQGADWHDIFNDKKKGSLRPEFRETRGVHGIVKEGGTTRIERMAEVAIEDGYIVDGLGIEGNAEERVLEMILAEIKGSPSYSIEWQEIASDQEEKQRYEDYLMENDRGDEIEVEEEPVQNRKVRPTTSREKLLRFAMSVSNMKSTTSVEFVAEAFGYGSGMEMLRDLMTAPSLKDAVEGATEKEMAEKYGDILDPESIMEEVRNSVNSEEQAEMLLKEIKALSRQARQPNIDRDYLKAQAKDRVENTGYKDLRPMKYHQAMIRHAQAAARFKALASKTQNKQEKADLLNKARESKILQTSMLYHYQEAVKTEAAMERNVKYIRDIGNRKFGKNEVDADFVYYIKTLSKLFALRNSPEREKAFSDLLGWYETQVNAAIAAKESGEPVVPLEWVSEYLVNALVMRKTTGISDFKPKEMQQMTANEIRGIAETAKMLRFIGGQISQDQKADLRKELEGYAETVNENAGKNRKGKPQHERSKLAKVGDVAWGIFLAQRQLYGKIGRICGWNESDPMFQITRDVDDATFREVGMKRELTKKMHEALGPIARRLNTVWTVKKTVLKEDGKEWTLSVRAIFVLALNMGNQSNIDTVLLGLNTNYGEKTSFNEKFTHGDLMKMVSHLNEKELDAVNKIWAYKDEVLWPELSAVQMRAHGISSPKIEAKPFYINGTLMRGGHYRLHYKKSSKDAGRSEIEMQGFDANVIAPSQSASQIARVGSGGREVELDVLEHLVNDLSEDIHTICFYELALRLSKIFRGAKNPFVEAVIERYGHVYYETLYTTVKRIVKPEKDAQDWWIKASRYIRTNLTYAYLAYNIGNIVQQTTAISNVFSEIGEKYTFIGIAKFAAAPIANIRRIDAEHVGMANRTALINRDSMEALQKMDALHPISGAFNTMAFSPQAFMDSLVAYPCYIGAHAKFMAENKGKIADEKLEQEAIRFAMKSVERAVGTGLAKELGAMFHGGEAAKAMTFMGTFMNITLNRNIDNVEKFKAGKITWYELARRSGWLNIMPGFMTAFLMMRVDPDDEDFHLDLLKEVSGYFFATEMISRNIYSAATGFTPNVPVMSGLGSVGKGIAELIEMLEEDEELTGRDIGTIIRGVSAVKKLPAAGQVAKVFEASDKEDRGPIESIIKGGRK